MSEVEKNADGLVAIITGGASGIGRSTTERLATFCDAITIVDINEDKIKETETCVQQKNPSLQVLGMAADVRNEEQMEGMAEKTTEAFGRIDILVHSAGILRMPGSGPRLLPDISFEECHMVIDVNLKGTFLSNRAVLKTMMKQGSGSIVNIASTSGIIGRPFDSVYCASKFGVVGLSESLAEEMARYGIKVFAVLPDAVDTPLWDQNGPVSSPDWSLQPDRIAGVVEYLLKIPADTMLENIVVKPFKTRKRKRKKKPEAVAEAISA
ncbi:MAG: SDR family oxidoreductase [Verrucomicrobiota bacterium]